MPSSRNKLLIEGNKPTIDDLERILNREEDVPFEILPNGQIVESGGRTAEPKPLTFRENIGGEYAVMLPGNVWEDGQ